MANSIDDRFARYDLPPHPGPELREMRLDALERRVAMLESVVSGMQRLAAGDDEDPVDGPEPGFMRIDMPVTEQ